jgi:hypothetical protein
MLRTIPLPRDNLSYVCHCTITVSVVLLLEFPELAVTVTLYVLTSGPMIRNRRLHNPPTMEKLIREEKLMARTPVETRQGPTALDEAGAEPGHSL